MTIVEFEQQVAEFIETVYRRDQLRQEFRRVYEAIDLLGEDLDADAFHCLLNNARAHLDTLAAELDVAEQSTAALYPRMRAFLDEEEELSASAPPAARFSPSVDAATAAENGPEETPSDAPEETPADAPDWGDLEGGLSPAVEMDAASDALPGEGDGDEADGTADTVSPESPFGTDALPAHIDAKDAGGSFRQEEEMLFWLSEREKGAASEIKVPRRTLEGVGHPADMDRLLDEDEAITQIINKGGMA